MYGSRLQSTEPALCECSGGRRGRQAWTQCDFGGTFTVSRVCVLSSWRPGNHLQDATLFQVKFRRPGDTDAQFSTRGADFEFSGSLCYPNDAVGSPHVGCFEFDEPVEAAGVRIYDILGHPSHIVKIDNVVVFAEGAGYGGLIQ